MKKVCETALHVAAFRSILSPPTRTHIMTITNAIKAVTKAGFTIQQDGILFTASKAGCKYVVEFMRNGREDLATCIGYRREDDENDMMTDYCATRFTSSLKKAIYFATA